MNIAFLTTDTLHHAFFARELAKAFPIQIALLESKPPAQPFPCAHAFEAERDGHERRVFFSGGEASVKDFAPSREFADVNAPEALAVLREARPEAVLVFGTGKLKGPLIDMFPGRLVNLHGGDPEEYRGLDSHLWAVYHKEFQSLVTTLHFVDKGLDTGRIIQQVDVPLSKGMALPELRAANTRACLELCLSAFSACERLGRFPSRRQRRKGRYYGAMPAVLKDLCVTRFAAHTGSLP
ncbi:MAG: formyltransferase family protein [Fibrobacteria bacterium]